MSTLPAPTKGTVRGEVIVISDSQSSEGSVVRGRCLYVAAGNDPQNIILDHFSFVHVGRGHLCESDESCITQDGAYNGLLSCHQCCSQKCIHDDKGPRGTLDAITGVRAECEVGIQQGFCSEGPPHHRFALVDEARNSGYLK